MMVWLFESSILRDAREKSRRLDCQNDSSEEGLCFKWMCVCWYRRTNKNEKKESGDSSALKY